MDRVRLIERTFWCYRAGWASLVPILGLFPAAIAFHLFWKIREDADAEGEWNPASAYLWAGLMLSLVGGAESMLIVALPFVKWMAS